MSTSSLPDLNLLTLDKGSHKSLNQGACIMEAVSWFAGEPWTDRPACASTVLTAFGVSLNDQLPDDLRQRLIPFIPRIVGTRSDRRDERRGYLALDWLIRVYTPTWLELAQLGEDARALRELASIVDLETAAKAGPIVRSGRAHAAAAWDAARDAAGDAARDAAAAAAWAAARDAAGAAAGAAARDAAAAAARDAARDAAGDAARDAAGAAARDALAPTVRRLQESAIDLFDRMISADSAS